MKIDITKRLVFIDLDGTLIKTLSGDNFPRNVADMKLILPTWCALKEWVTRKGGSDWHIRVITNQGGIESGAVKEHFFWAKLQYICCALADYLGGEQEVNVSFDYCPYTNELHPKRKPGTGMIRSFDRLLDYDKEDMVMIGDASGRPYDFSNSDLKTAENYGISYIDVRDLWTE